MSTLIDSLFNRHKRIKGRDELDTLAISTDGTVQLVRMPIVRQFLADHHEGSTPLSWAVTDKLKPVEGIQSRHMVQLIAEDSCVPQLTKYEPKYTNDRLKSVMYEAYQRAKFNVDQENKRNLTFEIIKFGMLGGGLLWLGAMVLSRL